MWANIACTHCTSCTKANVGQLVNEVCDMGFSLGKVRLLVVTIVTAVTHLDVLAVAAN